MIEKRSHVPAFDPIHGQNVFVLPAQDSLEKTASFVKEAQVAPEIASAIDGLKPEAGHRYVLVNGIGAGEYWANNRNGDYFPESGLAKRGEDYGYETFLSGHNFVHHANKDPQKSVGTVKAAHYNPKMHRVELLLDTDLSKLAKVDPALYEKVANGQPVDVSMGSKCDFDVCSICSNRAATRAEYCGHLKEAMGQILPDGRKVYAYTPHPRFFDISYVTKGADVTAKALHYLDKQASDGDETSAAAAEPVPATPSAKVAAAPEVPAFDEDLCGASLLLESVEEIIPGNVLDKMASLGFAKTLSTCSHLGVVLRPEEYQRVALASMGLGEIAEKCAAENAVIDPSAHGTWFDPSLQVVFSQVDPGNWSPEVAELLAPHVPGRTILEPYFSKRAEAALSAPSEALSKAASARALVKDASSFMTPSLAAALALGYLIYRRGVPGADLNTLKGAIHDKGLSRKIVTVVIPLIAAGSVVDKMMGFEPPTGSEKRAGIGAELMLPVAATYLYSAHARRKAERGEPISGLQHMFLEYPLPLSLAGVAGIAALKHRLKRTVKSASGMISPEVMKTATIVPSMSDMALTFGSGVYRPRASSLIGMIADNAILAGIGAALVGAKKLVSTDKGSPVG